MIKHLSLLTATAGLLLVSGQRALAQGNVEWVGATGDYSDGSNWSTGFVPDGMFVLGAESGVINNGGTAQVDTEIVTAPENLILGDAPGDAGTLEVLDGGTLPILNDLQVGNGTTGGEGHLVVQPGGTLDVGANLRNLGAGTSSVMLGGTGAGTATVTVGDEAELRRTTHVIGPNVDFSAGSLILGGEHTLAAEITGTTHSPLQASGTATLGGALDLQFDGPTPSPGDSWQIVDAANINGSFSSVTSNVTITEPGFGFFLETVPGGANGRVAQVSVDARLLLEVDRETGAVTLNNVTETEPFDIDGYLITSPGNSLDPGGWSSFAADGQANWRESNPAPNHVGELNVTDSRVVAAGETISLGNLYGPSEFGVTDDLAFQYHLADGQSESGLVQYMGPHNNLVLIVDPDTGEAALQNQSTIDVDIDGYLITSASNALNPDGWTSLEEGGMAGWRESNPAANHIGELNLDGSSLLGGRSSAIPLGTLFDLDNPDAEQDLAFEFHVAGGETLMGIVEYGEIPDIMPPMLDGDYNNNGQVEQADLDLVLLNWGESFENLPAEWINQRPTMGIVDQAELDGVLLNWGNTAALGAVAAIPEPASCVLAALAFLAATATWRRTRLLAV